jgi:hypothetical protein
MKYFVAEINQFVREVPVEEMINNEEDSGPFLRIESVVSLNPEAMGTEDVSSFFDTFQVCTLSYT